MTRFARRHAGGILAALLPLAAGPAGAAHQTLDILPRVETAGAEIVLQDLVGDGAALPDAWRERSVLAAPEPGRSRQYTIESIACALQKYPDMGQVVLRGKPSTTVVRAGQPVDLNVLTAAIERFVAGNEPWLGRQVQVLLEPGTERLMLPEAAVTATVRSFEATRHADRYRFHVALGAGQDTARITPVEALVLPRVEVWVATAPLERGQTLAPQSFSRQLLPMKGGDAGYIPTEEDIAGLELVHAVRPGEPISRHFVRQPLCCRRGEAISVTSERGGLHVQLLAQALASGRRGDSILCMNRASKRRFLVRLVEAKTGIVDDAQ